MSTNNQRSISLLKRMSAVNTPIVSPSGLSLLMDGNAIQPGVGKANISNAKFLEGDIAGPYGDPTFGDPTYGDLANADAALVHYDTLVGDIAEDEGDINIPSMLAKLPPVAKIGLGLVGAGGAYIGGKALYKKISGAVQRHRARKRALTSAQNKAAQSAGISNQQYAQGRLRLIDPRSLLNFYSASGATLVGYPITPDSKFVASDLTFGLNYAAGLSPFLTQIQPALQATPGVTPFIANIVGPVNPRYFSCIIITIGGNLLQTNPGIIFDVTCSIPLANGETMIVNSSDPWQFVFQSKFEATIVLFPYWLVATKPYLIVGKYSATAPINVQLSPTLPAGATVNVSVPGAEHVWTKSMRNSLITGLVRR